MSAIPSKYLQIIICFIINVMNIIIYKLVINLIVIILINYIYKIKLLLIVL